MQAYYPNDTKVIYYQLKMDWEKLSSTWWNVGMFLEFAQLSHSLYYIFYLVDFSGIDEDIEKRTWRCKDILQMLVLIS